MGGGGVKPPSPKDVIKDPINAIYKSIEDLPGFAKAPIDLAIHGLLVVGGGVPLVVGGMKTGMSFSEALTNSTEIYVKNAQNIYTNVFQDTLQFGDNSIMGQNDWLSQKIAEQTRRTLYDDVYEHAHLLSQVIGAVSSIFLSIFGGYLGGAFGSMIASIVGSYLTSYMSVQSAQMLIYGNDIIGLMQMYAQKHRLEELTREQNFSDSMDGTIFEKMAGGILYNAVGAGGTLYSYDQQGPLDASVGGMFNIGAGTKLLEFVDEEQAGSAVFAQRFDLQPMNTSIDDGGFSGTARIAQRNMKIRDYNAMREEYEQVADEYDQLVADYNSIVNSYNALSDNKKTKDRYDAVQDRLTTLKKSIDASYKEATELQQDIIDFWK